MRRFMASTAAFIAALLLSTASVQAESETAGASAPVPRFVSLATEGAYGRNGPGLDHRISWIYQHVGLPLQVTAESGPWRRVRDPDGTEVWMHARNLDARRTVYLKHVATLRRAARAEARALAHLRAGVIASITGCHGDWRRISVGGRIGWVEADAVWGSDCAGL